MNLELCCHTPVLLNRKTSYLISNLVVDLSRNYILSTDILNYKCGYAKQNNMFILVLKKIKQ